MFDVIYAVAKQVVLLPVARDAMSLRRRQDKAISASVHRTASG